MDVWHNALECLCPHTRYLIVVLLFLFRSFIPILSLYKAAGSETCCYFNMWSSGILFILREHKAGCVLLTTSQLSFVQPFSQNSLELAGVFKAQLQIFKAADRGLAEL